LEKGFERVAVPARDYDVVGDGAIVVIDFAIDHGRLWLLVNADRAEGVNSAIVAESGNGRC
jgi:hypothetical protein